MTTSTSASTSERAIISARKGAAVQSSSLTLFAQRLTTRLTKLLPTAKAGQRHGRIAKSTFSSAMHPDSNEEMTVKQNLLFLWVGYDYSCMCSYMSLNSLEWLFLGLVVGGDDYEEADRFNRPGRPGRGRGPGGQQNVRSWRYIR